MNEERGKGEESLDESHRVAQILEQEDKTDQEGPKKKKMLLEQIRAYGLSNLFSSQSVTNHQQFPCKVQNY